MLNTDISSTVLLVLITELTFSNNFSYEKHFNMIRKISVK